MKNPVNAKEERPGTPKAEKQGFED